MNKQAKKATSRIWSHYAGQILSREAFTTFGGFSDIVDPIIQQAIDAALAEQGAGLQGLVDAAEKAAKARDLDEIDGVLLDLDKALSIFRAGKPTLPAEVVKVLKQCEWEGRSADVRQYGCCPSCHRFRRDGHAGDCEYAALLAPYRKEQEDVQPN